MRRYALSPSEPARGVADGGHGAKAGGRSGLRCDRKKWRLARPPIWGPTGHESRHPVLLPSAWPLTCRHRRVPGCGSSHVAQLIAPRKGSVATGPAHHASSEPAGRSASARYPRIGPTRTRASATPEPPRGTYRNGPVDDRAVAPHWSPAQRRWARPLEMASSSKERACRLARAWAPACWRASALCCSASAAC